MFSTTSSVVAAAAAGQKAWSLSALTSALIWVSPPWVQPHSPGEGGREGEWEDGGGEKWVEEDSR